MPQEFQVDRIKRTCDLSLYPRYPSSTKYASPQWWSKSQASKRL